MLKHFVSLVAILILVSCGTNKLRLGKKHVHSPCEKVDVAEERMDEKVSNAIPVKFADSIQMEVENTSSDNLPLAPSERKSVTKSKKASYTQTASEEEIEQYPGRGRRTHPNLGRKLLGTTLIVLGVIVGLGVIIANVGAYGVGASLIIAPLIGLLIITMGILLVRVRTDRGNIKILGIILSALAISGAVFVIVMSIISSEPLGLLLLIPAALLLWLGIALVKRANRYG